MLDVLKSQHEKLVKELEYYQSDSAVDAKAKIVVAIQGNLPLRWKHVKGKIYQAELGSLIYPASYGIESSKKLMNAWPNPTKMITKLEYYQKAVEYSLENIKFVESLNL